MATNFIVKPTQNIPAYSTIPVQIEDDTAALKDYFNYLISVAWDEAEIVDMEPAVWNGQVWAKLLTGGTFKKGEKVLLVDMGPYSGLRTILDVNGYGELIIDIEPTLNFGDAAGAYPRIYRSINWRIPKDADAQAKLDIHRTVKDWVEAKFEDTSNPRSAAETRFTFKIFAHSEWHWKETIAKPVNDGGLAQISIANSSFSTTPVKIGDKIKVAYEMVGVQYSDNNFQGDLAFQIQTGTWPFLTGQTIFVQGQLTHPDYNGETSVVSLTSADTILITPKPWLGNTTTEGGTIFGTPRPDWNGVFQVTDIQESGTNLLITFNAPFGTALPTGIQLTGTVTFADDVVIQSWNDEVVESTRAFIGKQEDGWNSTFMNKYVFNGLVTGNQFATILSPETQYNIETTSKQWLLAHDCPQLGSDFMVYNWYDTTDTLIATSTFDFAIWNDTYFPIGPNQVLTSPAVITDNPITVDEVARYEVFPGGDATQQDREPFLFKVGFPCTQWETWHLIWRDQLGSFLSYPFKGASLPQIEKESKSYYNTNFYAGFANSTWTKNLGGEREYFNRSRERIDLQTDWVAPSELFLIKDLFKSTQVLIQSPSGDIKQARIVDTNIPLDNETRELYQLKLSVAYSENKYNY